MAGESWTSEAGGDIGGCGKRNRPGKFFGVSRSDVDKAQEQNILIMHGTKNGGRSI